MNKNRSGTTPGWYFSIARKFLKVVPTVTFSIVTITLISLFSQVVAFLLPLKVLILLGSSEVPDYFPEQFIDYGHRNLVITLSCIAGGFYAIHLLANKAATVLTQSATALLLRRAEKMPLFLNQEELTQQAYRNFSQSVAGTIFVLLGLLILAMGYTKVFLTLALYALLASVIFFLLRPISPSLHKSFRNNPMPAISTVGGIGFLIVFAFLVYDLLNGTSPGILYAIIALLLTRQMVTRLIGVIGGIRALHLKRFELSALLYQGHYQSAQKSHRSLDFWALTESPLRNEVIREALNKVNITGSDHFQVEWYQSGVPEIITFSVNVQDEAGTVTARFLVKLFNLNRNILAQHEMMLLSEMPGLPSLPLIGVTTIRSFTCHIFELPQHVKLSLREFNMNLLEYQKALMSYKPAPRLSSQFQRTHMMLWQRVDSYSLIHLETIRTMIDNERAALVQSFVNNLGEICERLKNMPLTVVNADLRQDTLLKLNSGELVSTHWGRWALEPVGAGWPIRSVGLKKLSSAHKYIVTNRSDMKETTERDFHLAALMFAFVSHCQRQNFIGAIDLLPDIQACISSGG